MPIAGGSADVQPSFRWRCRSCGTKLRDETLPDGNLWQRRRPIASWLFGR